MKTIVKKKLPKKIIFLSVVALLLVASALLYLFAFRGNLFGLKVINDKPTETNLIDYSPATKEQQDAGSKAKTGSSDIPAKPTEIPGSDKKSVQVTITAANQNDTTLQIRAQIGAVENGGKCTLKLVKTGQTPIVNSSSIQPLSSTSTCNGFDIQTPQLAKGTWNATIEYSSSLLTGTATQDVVIK